MTRCVSWHNLITLDLSCKTFFPSEEQLRYCQVVLFLFKFRTLDNSTASEAVDLCQSQSCWYLGVSAEALASGTASLLSFSASMEPHMDVTQVFPDHMRILFTGLPLKIQGGDRYYCLYVVVNTVNVFWRWQALLLPFREYVKIFLCTVIVSENRSFLEKA